MEFKDILKSVVSRVFMFIDIVCACILGFIIYCTFSGLPPDNWYVPVAVAICSIAAEALVGYVIDTYVGRDNGSDLDAEENSIINSFINEVIDFCISLQLNPSIVAYDDVAWIVDVDDDTGQQTKLVELTLPDGQSLNDGTYAELLAGIKEKIKEAVERNGGK